MFAHCSIILFTLTKSNILSILTALKHPQPHNLKMSTLTAEECAFVKGLADDAGKTAISYLDGLEIEWKSPGDFVTSADTAVQKQIVDALRMRFPRDGIVAEEQGGDAEGTSGRIWVVDPIDGTTNFARGASHWGVSIGCYDKQAGTPIFGAVNFPALGQLLLGGKDISPMLNGEPLSSLTSSGIPYLIVDLGCGPPDKKAEAVALFQAVKMDYGWLHRDYGCGTYSLLDVALGRADGYFSAAESSWDVMGMLPIIEALGGSCNVNWKRVDLESKFPIACGNGRFMEAVRNLKAHDGNI